MSTINIELGPELIEMLHDGKSISLRLSGPRDAASLKENSLPARVIAWAKKRQKEFVLSEVQKKFEVSRAHAGMLLSRLTKENLPIIRVGRGTYQYKRTK